MKKLQERGIIGPDGRVVMPAPRSAPVPSKPPPGPKPATQPEAQPQPAPAQESQ
jgi:hypothetical protein